MWSVRPVLRYWSTLLSGRVLEGYIGSGIDITDLKQHHDRMLAAQKLESLGVMAGRGARFQQPAEHHLLGSGLVLAEMDSETPGCHGVERINTVVGLPRGDRETASNTEVSDRPIHLTENALLAHWRLSPETNGKSLALIGSAPTR
jgi:hypothetical protein